MDEVYIEKVIKGDTNAFQYFVKTYKDFAFSLSYSILKNESLTEDVVQEAFIKAFKGLKSFKGNARFQTWFGKIVINESLRNLKSNTSQTVFLDEISAGDIEAVKGAVNLLKEEEQKYYITTVLEDISPNESLALELFYLKENPIEEIRQMTGWSLSKTKMLLSRGRKSFYGKLKNILQSEIRDIL